MEKEILFEESQKFRQWWIWLIMALEIVIIFFGVFQIITSQEIKNKLIPLIIIVPFSLSILVPTILLFLYMRLETQVRKDGIYVKFFPFHRSFREYKWDTVSKSFVRQYDPIGEYGGWGLRNGPKGKAFNVSGDEGLQLEFIDNKNLLIGTNKPKELKNILLQIGQLKD